MFNYPVTISNNTITASLPVTTNLILHLDSSKLTSITKDESNLVSQWNDLSGLNNHVYQSNNALKPTWTTAIQNNLDGIRWINNNTGLRTSTNVGGKHGFIVLKHIESGSTFGGFRRVIDKGDTDPNGYSLFGMSGETNYNPNTFYRNISNQNVWINRVQTIDAAPISNTKLVEFITNNLVNPGILAIGTYSASDVNQNIVGYMFEVILYSDTKSSTEINLISNYLNTKWAIY